MATIGLCMIVKNEEQTLGRCLDSVRDIMDEIIIVDTGSDDATKEVAARYTDKIFDFEWCDDFAAARNFSYSKATCDFVMWMDADDVMLGDDAAELAALKASLSTSDDAVIMMRYNTGFDAAGRVTFSYYRERLTRRNLGGVWREPVHEYFEAHGRRRSVDIAITHKKPPSRPSGRNLYIYETQLASGAELSPRGMYYYARELRDHGRFAEAAARFCTFLDDGRGWVEDNISACGEMSDCLLAVGRDGEALNALWRSFEYAPPRAEICCQLGYYFKQRRMWRQAEFWYETALRPEKDAGNAGFRRPECRGFIPCIELAVCCDALGEYERGNEYNERAATFKPDAAAVERNRRYFAERLTAVRQSMSIPAQPPDGIDGAPVVMLT